MKTVIYLVRHSEGLKRKVNIINSDSLQITNEKNPLSVNGEKKAEELSKIAEMKYIDLVISSNYVRTISTAKYICDVNDKDLHIIETFGERKHGVSSWDELPENFELKQMQDKDYKIENGESQVEVATRMYDSLVKVLKENLGKRIVIVSHATAITFLFMKLGKYKDNCVYFKDSIVIDKDFKWNAPEVFKLEFIEEELISIENVIYNKE